VSRKPRYFQAVSPKPESGLEPLTPCLQGNKRGAGDASENVIPAKSPLRRRQQATQSDRYDTQSAHVVPTVRKLIQR
jgi:hypothetical protein